MINPGKETMKRFWRVIPSILAITAAVFAIALDARAQEGGGNQQQAQTAQLTTKDSLQIVMAENKTLETILRSIESIDTARQNELIQWIITDRTIRSRVISALRKSGYYLAPNSVAELTVTQKPPTTPDGDMALLRIVIEQIGVYGEPDIRRVLGSTLYDEINSRQGYEFTLISTEQEQKKIQFLALNASLYGGDMIFKSGFGFAVNLGDDYIGYPFWLPGTIGTYGIIKRESTDIRLGIEWPLGESGVSPFVISQGLQIRGSKLAGAMALAAELKQDLGVLAEQSGKMGIGAEFRNAITPTITSFPNYATQQQYASYNNFDGNVEPPKGGSLDINSIGRPLTNYIYYLALSTHAYLSYSFPNQSLRGAYFQLGGGMHSVQPVTIGDLESDPQNKTQQDLFYYDRLNYFDPFAKIGYIHTSESGEDFGLSVQYSNTLLTDAWVKLFSWLEIEAKYSTVVGRDPYAYEWKDYVMISPKLIFNF
jgi:hypothetical protein